MEEVIGSIPIRSTNYFNNLDDLALSEKGPRMSNRNLPSALQAASSRPIRNHMEVEDVGVGRTG
jgi:hypothetical protein